MKRFRFDDKSMMEEGESFQSTRTVTYESTDILHADENTFEFALPSDAMPWVVIEVHAQYVFAINDGGVEISLEESLDFDSIARPLLKSVWPKVTQSVPTTKCPPSSFIFYMDYKYKHFFTGRKKK